MSFVLSFGQNIFNKRDLYTQHSHYLCEVFMLEVTSKCGSMCLGRLNFEVLNSLIGGDHERVRSR